MAVTAGVAFTPEGWEEFAPDLQAVAGGGRANSEKRCSTREFVRSTRTSRSRTATAPDPASSVFCIPNFRYFIMCAVTARIIGNRYAAAPTWVASTHTSGGLSVASHSRFMAAGGTTSSRLAAISSSFFAFSESA